MTPMPEQIYHEPVRFVPTDDPATAKVFQRHFAPLLGVAHTDVPEEGEASERHTREVITYTDESTTLGEVLRTAQALENAGFEARVRFTRQHDETGMVWGLSIGVRERA